MSAISPTVAITGLIPGQRLITGPRTSSWKSQYARQISAAAMIGVQVISFIAVCSIACVDATQHSPESGDG